MTILLYRPNEDQEYADACRIQAEQAHPMAKIREVNPDHFKADDMDAADAIYVRPRYTEVVEAYQAAEVPVYDVSGQPAEIDPDAEVEVGGTYEDDVVRLLSMPVRQLEGALSRVDDLAVLYLARAREQDVESGGQGRVSCVKFYDKAIRALGGE